MNAKRDSTESCFCPVRHKEQLLLRTTWVLLPKVSQAEGLLHIFFSDSKKKVVESRGTLLISLWKLSCLSFKARKEGSGSGESPQTHPLFGARLDGCVERFGSEAYVVASEHDTIIV